MQAFTKKEIGGISTLPVGDWVTDNFEFIRIDTSVKSFCILSNGDGSEATTSNAYLFGDTLSLQAVIYQLMPSRDTIVHR